MELKTGQRPTQLQNKSYKPGETVFEKVTTGREFFIVQEGKVGIYKNTPEGDIELASLKKAGSSGKCRFLTICPIGDGQVP